MMRVNKIRSLLWIVLIVPVCSMKTSKKLTTGCFYKYDYNTCEIYIDCIDSVNTYEINYDALYTQCSQFYTSIAFRRTDFGDMDTISWINNDNKRIVSLDLSHNQFKYMPTLDLMPNLKKLNMSHNILNVAKLSNEVNFKLNTIDFSYNKIMQIELNAESNIYTDLKILDLSHNFIDVVPDGIFNSFQRLEHLNLSYNHLMDLNSMSFKGAGNLQTLDLGYNHIIDINSAFLELVELQQLSLSNNLIDRVLSRDFLNLRNVIKLDLSYNDISYIENGTFNNMTLLNYLDLSENALDNIDKNCFVYTIYLNTIYLSGNSLKNIPYKLFEGKNITKILLNRNIIEGSLSSEMFSGLNGVVKFEISNQNLNCIEDFAFYGLDRLEILLLNNNNIQNVSKNSFKLLKNIKLIDLSYNHLRDFDFDKSDLLSLRTISLKNNLISNLDENCFYGLEQLQVLDISDNYITELGINTFKQLNLLVKLSISISFSSIISSAFNERTILKYIDTSFSEMPLVSNYSFNNMKSLTSINMSHSEIEVIEYNSFSGTTDIIEIDLSFNKLTYFVVNSTDLLKLSTLKLNNNNLSEISYDTFRGFRDLLYINLSYNNLSTISDDTFSDLINLRFLDLSYNTFYKTFDFLGPLNNLKYLNISGEGSDILSRNVSFTSLKENRITELVISKARLQNPNNLYISNLKSLNILILSHNMIRYIKKELLSKVYRIREVDLSFNEIEYIQPGAFQNNVHLKILNVSHNYLTNFKYGTFHGLIRLNVLDLYNNRIDRYQKEIFNEAEHLNILILDKNRISHINYADFIKTSLLKLSIGNNFIPCKEISALVIFNTVEVVSENTDADEENINGINCRSI